MWRRLSCHLQLTLTPPRSSTIIHRRPAVITASPSPAFFSRNFFTETVVPKKVEDVMPIATGHEREELEAELQGRKVVEIDNPEGPFGTKEAPAIIKSYYDKRIVGCPGGEGEDEHDVVWFWLDHMSAQSAHSTSSWKWLVLEDPQMDMEMKIIISLYYGSIVLGLEFSYQLFCPIFVISNLFRRLGTAWPFTQTLSSISFFLLRIIIDLYLHM